MERHGGERAPERGERDLRAPSSGAVHVDWVHAEAREGLEPED